MMYEREDLPPRLRCVDGRLIKPNGSEIFLRGPCFGSWGEDQAEDATAIRAMGANCLRVCLRWWGRYGSGNGHSIDSRDNDGFAFLLRANVQRWFDQITQAAAAGLWVIPFIDTNCGQSGTNSPEDVAYCDPHGTWGALGHNFYTDAGMLRVFASIVWPAMALRLRPIARIAMLEIHPEPAIGRGPRWAAAVARVQRECIEDIRRMDPDTPILVGGREGYDIRQVEEAFDALGPVDSQLVWTGNLLNPWVRDPARFDEGLAHLTRLRAERGACVFVQQLGRNSAEDEDLVLMQRAVDRMREENIGYNWWQWRQNTADPGKMGLHYKTRDGAGWIEKTGEVELLTRAWSA
jgi:hypothetical protein